MANLLFSPSLNIISSTAKNITIGLSVRNIANIDCYIYTYEVLLAGSIRETFNITNEYGESGNYIGLWVKLKPKLMLLPTNQSTYVELNLSDNYQIPEGNKFAISFESGITCCKDSLALACLGDELLANTTVVIGEV